MDVDADAERLLLEQSRSGDASVRRLAAELLGDLDTPAAVERSRALADDPDAEVRRRAVAALARREGAVPAVRRALNDEDVGVRATAAAVLCDVGDADAARPVFDELLASQDTVVRRRAVHAIGTSGSSCSAAAAERSLEDPDAGVRRESMLAVASERPERATATALALLCEAEEPAAVDVLVRVGAPAVPAILESIGRSPCSAGILVAVAHMDAREHEATIRRIADERVAAAERDERMEGTVARRFRGDAVGTLLRDALRARARRAARAAFLLATSVSTDRRALRDAVANLDVDDHGVVANALETLDVGIRIAEVRRLTRLWEPTASVSGADGDVSGLVRDPDEVIRRCASALLGNWAEEDGSMDNHEVMSPVERLVALRAVPVFATLDPADLSDVADRTEEQVFDDGEVIAEEGELGDRLFVIVSGTVDVVRAEAKERVAVRREGDVVGELTILSRQPRVASLVARGAVRTLGLSRDEFGTIVLERPDVGLAVMSVLAGRLGEATRGSAVPDDTV
jgi:HEAT repeat protein